LGQKLTLCWNASASEVVCAVLMRSGRHFTVAYDWAAAGPTLDAVRAIAANVRAAYPRAQFEAYVPAELNDAWQRIALVPALRQDRLTPWRGEHTTVSRGALAEKIRTTLRQRRLLTVAKDATLTLNALAAGYKYPIASGGKQGHDPEPGLPRLVAEALESTVAMLDRGLDNSDEVSGNFGLNAQGVRYRTALPANPRRT
jgi:hypothetical protein